MVIRFMITLAVCAGLALAGCGTAEWDWNKAAAANTLAAYQAFVKDHPGDRRAEDARGRILALQDEQAWAAALKANSLEGFQDYLKAEGGGVHAEQAQFQITAIERAAAWKELPSDATAESLQVFLQKFPQGAESVLARTKLADLAYRVQLADLRSKSGAESKRAQLQAKFGSVLREVVVIAPSAPSTTYRVTSGLMSQARAKSACETLERAHQNCKLVQDAPTSG
jgi:hypothetical protein